MREGPRPGPGGEGLKAPVPRPLGLPIAREGIPFILAGLLSGLLLLPLSSSAGGLLLGFGIFCCFFFRDFERNTPQGDRLVVSPADGKVIEIAQVSEPSFIGGPAQRISIFMSVFDGHVNRAPVSGRVAYRYYSPGEFHMAFVDKASELNEQLSLGLEYGDQRYLVRQIAGWVARRIVCYAELGDELKCGSRYGMIRFGSRVDLFLPVSTSISVRVGDRVRAGETVLGEVS
ncbi:MAG: phosphatidylserine decarboxylase family protein [Candidatus Wallbacteria bacterium]|nr:phosphatidylserine decarboxylase family protein [Candidatus Wallbacteria bacterium]